MLVTSREHLQLSSETLFVLDSMAHPSAATLPDVLSYNAVQLWHLSAGWRIFKNCVDDA